MYLHIGQETVVPLCEVVGIFDMENTTISKNTRSFLNDAQKKGTVITVGDDGITEAFKFFQIVDNTASKESGSIIQRRFVNNHIGTFCFDAFHNSLY